MSESFQWPRVGKTVARRDLTDVLSQHHISASFSRSARIWLVYILCVIARDGLVTLVEMMRRWIDGRVEASDGPDIFHAGLWCLDDSKETLFSGRKHI
jgi:hypothetical protein